MAALKGWRSGRIVSEEVHSNDHAQSCSLKLLSLNLSHNKIYWLDGLAELIEKAPQVKILNLSKNLVRR